MPGSSAQTSGDHGFSCGHLPPHSASVSQIILKGEHKRLEMDCQGWRQPLEKIETCLICIRVVSSFQIQSQTSPYLLRQTCDYPLLRESLSTTIPMSTWNVSHHPTMPRHHFRETNCRFGRISAILTVVCLVSEMLWLRSLSLANDNSRSLSDRSAHIPRAQILTFATLPELQSPTNAPRPTWLWCCR